MIATVTLNPYLEDLLHVDGLPLNGSVTTKKSLRLLGGPGLNTARMVRRIDPQAAAQLYGLLGGHGGAAIAAGLDAEGVEHSFVDTGLEPRSDVTFVIMAQRGRVHVETPGPEVDAKHAEELKKLVMGLDPAPRFLALCGGVPGASLPPTIDREFYAQLMTDLAAKKPDVKIALNARGAELGQAVHRAPWLVRIDGDELAYMAGRKRLVVDKDYVLAADDLIERYKVGVFAVSVGKSDSIIVTADQRFKAAAPSIDAVSTRNVGPSLLAGLLVGLSKDQSLEDAAKLGTAAATASATTRESTLPSRKDIDKALAGIRIEKL